jgi:hypothetical protein
LTKFLVEQAQLGRAPFQHAGVGLEHAFLTLNAFRHGLLVSGHRCLAGQEQLLLVLDMPGNHRVGLCGLDQILVKFDRRAVGLFGEQAPLHGPQRQVALPARLVGGFGHRVVQPDEGLARLDDRALADQNLLDDAARLVLDRLAFGVDGDHRGAWDAFVQRGQAGPEQEAAEPDAEGPQADAHGARRIGILGVQAVFGFVDGIDRLWRSRRGVQLLEFGKHCGRQLIGHE